ncbi:hypothetical protein [Aquibacillus salsiterrae]|uniref:Uncharacterized protein n=1 Tax=Aquibacillus salsiterrae TaxID=2950439 RepID=A0A9X3WFQ3_9BACI|nr:hypothetical protein [Aquibacillus salsiterrae]MDC3418168.1 hypothetical protein [Aquibacillus salsiterrae]
MVLNEIKNLQFYSQLSVKQIEDRLLITAEFPKAFLAKHKLVQPFLYVTLYVRGGALIKIIDEGTVEIHSPTKKDIAPTTYNQIILYAMKYAPQFKHLSIPESIKLDKWGY